MDGDSSAFGAVGALKGYFYWEFICQNINKKINTLYLKRVAKNSDRNW